MIQDTWKDSSMQKAHEYLDPYLLRQHWKASRAAHQSLCKAAATLDTIQDSHQIGAGARMQSGMSTPVARVQRSSTRVRSPGPALTEGSPFGSSASDKVMQTSVLKPGQVRNPLTSSAPFSAVISVRSPRKIFMSIICKHIFWIKVSKKIFNLILVAHLALH